MADMDIDENVLRKALGAMGYANVPPEELSRVGERILSLERERMRELDRREGGVGEDYEDDDENNTGGGGYGGVDSGGIEGGHRDAAAVAREQPRQQHQRFDDAIDHHHNRYTPHQPEDSSTLSEKAYRIVREQHASERRRAAEKSSRIPTTSSGGASGCGGRGKPLGPNAKKKRAATTSQALAAAYASPPIINAKGEYYHQQRFKPYVGLEQRLAALEAHEAQLEAQRAALLAKTAVNKTDNSIYHQHFDPRHLTNEEGESAAGENGQNRNITFADENESFHNHYDTRRRPLTSAAVVAQRNAMQKDGGNLFDRPASSSTSPRRPTSAVTQQRNKTGEMLERAHRNPLGDVRRNEWQLRPHPFLSPHASNVIYSYTDNIKYRSPVAAGGGVYQQRKRPVTDVVAKGRAMREQWSRDAFLMQRGRNEERWEVRRSMIALPPQ